MSEKFYKESRPHKHLLYVFRPLTSHNTLIFNVCYIFSDYDCKYMIFLNIFANCSILISVHVN